MSTRVQHIRGTTAEIEAITPLPAEFGFDTSRKELHIGDGATAGGIRIPKKNISEVVIAGQITANQNNYSPTSLKYAGTLYISTDASRDITGMVPLTVTDSADGREIVLYNSGSFNAVLKDQSASSTAANRFDLGGSDVTLQPKNAVTLRYRTQGALNRWEIIARTDGQAIANGGVIASKLAASAMAFVGMINGTIVPSVAGSALTVALKTLAGADPSAGDPVYLIFRNTTPATGDYVVLTMTAANSLVVSSGSSLGVATNNQAFKLWGGFFNDAGTPRMWLNNCLLNSGTSKSIFGLSGFGIASSTAEGGAGAADSAHTFYTGTAVAAKAYIPAFNMTWESGLAAVGTWSAGPTRTQLFGPGVPLPGAVIADFENSTGSVLSGTTVLPVDNTIPQNTEGDQYFSQAITPSSAAHLIDVESELMLHNTAGTTLAIALFQDSGANAISVAASTQGATAFTELVMRYRGLPGTGSATTFKVRGGGPTAGTTTLNGGTGANFFSNTIYSYLRVKEIAT